MNRAPDRDPIKLCGMEPMTRLAHRILTVSMSSAAKGFRFLKVFAGYSPQPRRQSLVRSLTRSTTRVSGEARRAGTARRSRPEPLAGREPPDESSWAAGAIAFRACDAGPLLPLRASVLRGQRPFTFGPGKLAGPQEQVGSPSR